MTDKEIHYCSFCGSSNKEVAALVVDPMNKIAICDVCTDAASEQVKQHLNQSEPKDYLCKLPSTECRCLGTKADILATAIMHGVAGLIVGGISVYLYCKG